MLCSSCRCSQNCDGSEHLVKQKKTLSTYEHIYIEINRIIKHWNYVPLSFISDEGVETDDIKATCTTTQSEHHHYRDCVNRIIDGWEGKQLAQCAFNIY